MNRTKQTSLTAALAALLLCAASAGAGDVTVTSPGVGPGTSLDCPSGCKVSLNFTGDTAAAFVVDTTPTSERTMRIEFFIDMDAMTFPVGPVVRVLEVRQSTPFARVLFFAGVYFRNGNYKINFIGFNEDGSWNPVAGYDLKPIGATVFQVEFVAASGPSTNDGVMWVIKGNKEKGVTDYDLYLGGTAGVDQVRFGSVKPVDPSLNGSFFLDDYSSFRTLAP